jgi:hypothetical protein
MTDAKIQATPRAGAIVAIAYPIMLRLPVISRRDIVFLSDGF